MSERNRYGLSRYIPASIRREVRRRSRFGCVVCRSGFYQYEHIDPTFEDVKEHDPERICCLCGTCHDRVTRGHLSKSFVKDAYRKIQSSLVERVAPPFGPLDFHDGTAQLLIGGLLYSPAVRTVLRYHGVDLIQVMPAERRGEPGRISAVFTDTNGLGILRLHENEWVGSLEAWDIEVAGQRITVRRKMGSIALQLRLDPPGRIVIERLDMRIMDSHVLATERTYAVGRYIGSDSVHWVHAFVRIRRSSPFGVAIEFTTPAMLASRDAWFRGTAQELATQSRQVVINGNAGILVKPLGVAIAGLCGSIEVGTIAMGPRSLSDMRQLIVSNPEKIPGFVATGDVSE